MKAERAKRIKELQKEKDVVILAHYYVDGEVQEIADYVGDSFYLSKVATKVPQQNILFAGVTFMGESAKILNPGKTVVMADECADCPMAHMITPERIAEVRAEYDDLAVVCYVNSTAEIKAVSDVCVTSSNAVKVVKNIPQKNIFFVPDNNLGRYVSQMVPDKNFIFHDGFCHVHKSILAEELRAAKEAQPDALVLTHPECTQDVVEMSDFVGSTSEIIDFATESDAKKFIICTEMGVFFELQQKNPEKKFYSVGHRQFCPNMKKVTIDKVEAVLDKLTADGKGVEEIVLSDEVIGRAGIPLQRMLELAK
ncbi:MAG: quinolinate synthase NadA [Roseburia sp.]|nr:quinolinate synthase NadA [Roseburia sp.]